MRSLAYPLRSLLIAHGRICGLAHGGLDIGIADIRAGAARPALCALRRGCQKNRDRQ